MHFENPVCREENRKRTRSVSRRPLSSPYGSVLSASSRDQTEGAVVKCVSCCFLSNYEQRILSTVAWELSCDLSDNPPYSIDHQAL